MSPTRHRLYFLVAAALLLLVWPNNVKAVLAGGEHQYIRIFYYRETKRARDAFLNNFSSIDVLAPQVYEVNKNGELEGTFNEEILKVAKANNIKVMPLLTNKGFGTTTGALFLSNAAKQDSLINSLIREAIQRGFWGWQIDFEQIDSLFRNPYSYFIERMYNAFKKQGLVLSVAVVAQHSPNPYDYPRNLWQRVIGVYDYEALAQHSDFLSIMTYDDPFSTGPVAGLPWVKKVLTYAFERVPPEKISLGIPLYYWEWDDARQKIVEIGGYRGMQETLQSIKKVTKGYSAKEQTPFIRYKRNGRTYSLWYEDKRSLQAKLNLVRTYGLHGFSAWALGLEDPTIHVILRK